MPRYHILGGAKVTVLTGGTLGPTGTSFDVQDPSGWPTGGANGKFWVIINPGRSNEEHLLANARSGSTITLASVADRGLDGTVAGTHDSDSVIQHGFTGVESNDANRHIFDTTADDHTQYMRTDGTRHDLTTRHAVGTVVPAGTPGSIAIGDTVNAGAAATAARADHRHGAPSFAAPVSIGTANAAGAAATLPRSDHVHDIGAGAIDSATLFGSGLLPLFASTASPGAVANGVWLDTDDRILKVRNAANSAWEHWLDFSYKTWVPTLTTFNLGTGTKYGVYTQLGQTTICWFGFTIGAGASSAAEVLTLTLPVASVDPSQPDFNWIGAGRLFKPGGGGGRFASIGIINSSTAPGTIQSFATAGQDPWDNDSPVAPWTEGTIFNGFAVYRSAMVTS